MSTDAQQNELIPLAQEIFDLAKIVWIARGTPQQGDEYDLSEMEFLALDVLTKADSLTVGELQRGVGVLPAQMSRLIRSLERKAANPLVSCSLNPDDKRKIDVTLTDEGRKAHNAYQTAKLSAAMSILMGLDEVDRKDMQRLLQLIKTKMFNT